MASGTLALLFLAARKLLPGRKPISQVQRPVLIFVSLLFAAAGSAASPPWVRVDFPAGQGFHLDDFGLKNKWIEILSADTGSIEFYIANGPRRGIPRGFGPKPNAKLVPKEHGLSVDGSAAQAYLLFEDKSSGCQVYFDDTSDTKQNEYALLVLPGRHSKAASTQPVNSPPPRSRPPSSPGSLVEKSPHPASTAETTATPPHYSLLGETLLYHGAPLSDHVAQDAAKAGLDRDLFVLERVWAEKQRDSSQASRAEFERLKDRRLEHLSPETKAAVDRLRTGLLPDSQ